MTPRVVVALLVLAAFGPYLFGSVRTEQAAVYALAVALLPWILQRRVPSAGLPFITVWTGYILVGLVGVLAPPLGTMSYSRGDLFAGLDNVLLPIAVMLVVWAIVPPADADSLLQRALALIATAMAVNGAIAILSTWIELTPVLQPFWTGGSGSVAENAGEMGRYTGIFNQPAEAGALYGIAGLAAVYAWRHRPLLQAAIITLIAVGGLISVSKVFVLGALPIIVIYWIWSVRGHRKIVVTVGIALLTLGVLQSGILREWTGADYLGRLFAGNDGFVDLYSAGRFTESSTFNQVVDEALATNAVSGVGTRGWDVPYDGVIAEALVVGDLLGLALYAAALVAMVLLAFRVTGPLRTFTLLLAVLTVGAGLGFGPLTANRVSTITWLLIALIVLVAEHRLVAGETVAAKHAEPTPVTVHSRENE